MLLARLVARAPRRAVIVSGVAGINGALGFHAQTLEIFEATRFRLRAADFGP